MPWKRSLTEQGAYGLGYGALNNWANYPDDPQANVKTEEGGTSEDKPPTGENPGAAGGPIPEGPKVPGTNLPDESVENGQGDEYDGPTTGTTIGAAGGPIPDLISEAVAADDSISPKSIEDYKNELQKKYKIAVVPTIIIFKDGEEVARFQADLSFKMVATKEEVQEEINNQMMSDF